MKIKTGIMSSKIELEVESIDEAICVSMLYFQSNAPIAVYDTKEKFELNFPYDIKKVDEILGNMGERLKKSYSSIKVIL